MKLTPLAYPVRDDLQTGESGHGYVLRLATLNGVNGLSAVKSMLGKCWSAVLDADDAKALSQWFGADPERLACALGHTGTGLEPDAYEFGGYTLTRSYFVNRSQPRVCSECLSSDRYCLLAWELSAMTVCPRHRKTLCESCSNCGSSLRWNRPHISQCRCGWVIHDETSSSPADDELEIGLWIEQFLGSSFELPQRTRLGRLLSPLSLDAGLHILSALSSVTTRPSGQKVGVKPELRKRNSLASSRAAIANASHVLEQLERGSMFSWKVPKSCLELLAEVCASSYGPADRQMALSILSELRSKPQAATWSGRFPQNAQLSLF